MDLPSESILSSVVKPEHRTKRGQHGHDPVAVEKRRQALTLKVRGATTGEIGKALGVTRETVLRWIKQEMAIATRELREQSETLVAEMCMQLDAMIAKFGARVYGTQTPDPEAARVILRAIERKAKILGLEAPDVKIDVTQINVAIGPVVEAILAVIPDDLAPAVYDAVSRQLGPALPDSPESGTVESGAVDEEAGDGGDEAADG